MATVQGPVPVQSPLQPVKVAPVAGVAVRVTLLPLAKLAEQVLGVPGPQLRPPPAILPLTGTGEMARV